jgi:hypothetical protein
MKVTFERSFTEAEQAAIANHLGKQKADEADLRRFAEEALHAAVEQAKVEFEAFENDPSTSVGP